MGTYVDTSLMSSKPAACVLQKSFCYISLDACWTRSDNT